MYVCEPDYDQQYTDLLNEEVKCICTEKCDIPCKGTCGCYECRMDYGDFLSVE